MPPPLLPSQPHTTRCVRLSAFISDWIVSPTSRDRVCLLTVGRSRCSANVYGMKKAGKEGRSEGRKRPEYKERSSASRGVGSIL